MTIAIKYRLTSQKMSATDESDRDSHTYPMSIFPTEALEVGQLDDTATYIICQFVDFYKIFSLFHHCH